MKLNPEQQGPERLQTRRDVPLSRPDDDSSYGAGVTEGKGSGPTTSGRGSKSAESGLKKLSAALVVAAMATVGWFMMGPTSNQSSLAAETQAPAYQKHKLANPAAPVRLTSTDIDAAATKAALEAARAGKPIPGLSSASPELVAAIAKGDVDFYAVRAWDTCAEDGDYISITSSDGARAGSAMIPNAGTTLWIPVVRGTVPQLQLLADRDGGGGVTVGIQTQGGAWYSGILPEGSMQPLPVSLH
jgi:hypothetical protein